MSGLVGQLGARSGVVGSSTDSTQLEYEEGIFTLSIVNYSGGTAPAITTQNTGGYVNQYVKIGKVIHCSIFIELNFKNNEQVVFSGLPENAVAGGSLTCIKDAGMSLQQIGIGGVYEGTDDFGYYIISRGTTVDAVREFLMGFTYKIA